MLLVGAWWHHLKLISLVRMKSAKFHVVIFSLFNLKCFGSYACTFILISASAGDVIKLVISSTGISYNFSKAKLAENIVPV